MAIHVPVASSVLEPAGGKVCDAADATETDERDTNAVAGLVVGRILREEGIDGDDAANVAGADLEGRADRAAMVAAEVHREPADDDGHGRVRAHGDEKERGVLQMRPVVDVDEDAEADNGDADWEDGEREAVP
jgi:hypothetical protein